MLVYLDNAWSSSPDVNENYAAKLMELHTMGVDGGYTRRTWLNWRDASAAGALSGINPLMDSSSTQNALRRQQDFAWCDHS
jgi:uncharacterized protein (DUF1800 family)